MVAELELQHYQVKVGYLGFMNQYFICVQLISWLAFGLNYCLPCFLLVVF